MKETYGFIESSVQHKYIIITPPPVGTPHGGCGSLLQQQPGAAAQGQVQLTPNQPSNRRHRGSSPCGIHSSRGPWHSLILFTNGLKCIWNLPSGCRLGTDQHISIRTSLLCT